MIPIAESQVVLAGAGTGKTHSLVTAYLCALLGLDGDVDERSPARVLAITFTDKAASEMRRRVALRLQALARDPHADAEVNVRLAHLGRRAPEVRSVERMLRQLPTAPIATFHSLCAMLLRDLAVNAGIDPSFTLLEPINDEELLAETAEAVILDRLALGDRDIAELSARFSLRGLGGGRGLVGELVEVHKSLAERGVYAEELPLVMDTETADLRVVDARSACDGAIISLWHLTRGADQKTQNHLRSVFHDYRRLRDLLDRRDEDEETDLATTFHRVAEKLRKNKGRGNELRLAWDTAHHTLRALGVALCDRVTAPHAAALRAILVEMGERLQREKDQLGVLSFGDLLLRMRDLLRDQPDVRARVKGRYDRILVDEYQDTSPVQEDLVAFLSEEPTRGDRIAQGQRAMGQLRLAPGRLFVVGDPKQSIYGFRGADVKVFRNTMRVVVEGTAQSPPSGRARPLSVSWRSRPPVLALVNQVALQTLPAGGAGVEVAPEDMLQSQRLGDGLAGAFWVPVDAEQLEVESAEGIVVGRKIRDLIDQATLVGDESSLRPCRPGDIVVLVRRVKAAAPIVRALLHHGIPALLTGGEGFFQRPEVVDLIAALQLVLEPQDELATLTVLRSPLVAAPDDVIAQLPECIPGWRAGLCWRDMPGAAEHLDDAVRHRILFFDNLLTSLRHRLHQWSAAQMIDELLDQGRYAIALGVEPDAADRLANVEKLRALCEGGPGDAVRVIRRLWGWLDRPPRESMAVVAAPDADAVRIMSIHQAKGLEFPIVVLADVGSALPGGGNDVEVDVELGLAVSPRGRPIEGCGRGTRGLVEPPTIERVRQRRRAREEAELARLLYVALTRARDRVYVVAAPRERRAATLLQLLERGRLVDPRQFALLMPTEKVPAVLGPRRSLPAILLPDVRIEPQATAHGPLRVVPSALREWLAKDHEAPGSGTPLGGQGDARRRGRLAHHLIARLGERLAGGGLPDATDVKAAAHMLARAQGSATDDPETRALIAKVTDTVHGPLRRLVAAGCALRFEQPLRVPIAPGAVLVGTADLVVRGPEGIAVIELKSSRQSTLDPATAVQLAAYALALEKHGEADVRVASWQIGDPSPPSPGPVTDEAAATLRQWLARE